MSSLDEYANKYKTARMERRNGVLQVTLHTEGRSLRWGFLPHGELPEAFHDIGADRENRVVILTGTGDEFSGPRATPGTSSFPARPPIERIDRIHWEGRHLLMNLLNIEVPVIRPSTVRRGATRRSPCCATSSWRPRPPSSRIRRTSRRRSSPATACTSSTRCSWA